MKIAIVTERLGYVSGGIEQHATWLVAELTRLGHTVESYNRFNMRTLRPGSYDWIIVEGVFRRALLSLQVRGAFRKSKLALFTHGSFLEQMYRGELSSFGYSPNWATTVGKRLYDFIFMRRHLSKFRLVITLSHREDDEIRDYFRLGPVRFISLPIFGPRPPSIPNEDSPRESAGFEPYFCTVSRIDNRKNIGMAIDAVRGLPAWYLVGGRDGGGLTELLESARSTRAVNFRFVGELSEEKKWSMIRQSIGVVIPSYLEGVPHVALEAMSVGKPVICTRFSYIEPQPGLLLVPPTVEMIRKAMVFLLSGRMTRPILSYPTDAEILELLLQTLKGASPPAPNPSDSC